MCMVIRMLMTCKNCGSADIIKNGRKYGVNTVSQHYACKRCGSNFNELLDTLPARKSYDFKPAETIPREPATIDWSAYSEAQVNEKLLFLDILEDLCARLPEEENGKIGRPSASTREMAFCMVAKLYEGLSSRRVSSDLTIAMQRGLIARVPHFNTLLKYFNDPRMTPFLTDLIRLSALPLRNFETTFAMDASGLSSAFYSRWLDERLQVVKEHDWIKIHVICGVKSNIVTAIEVTDGYSNDSPHFPTLLRETARNFRVKEISADKGYLGRKNLAVAFELGAVPYIPFKINSTSKKMGSLAWVKMYHYFHLHQDEFMSRYHLRSNVESTFSAVKRKFSRKLMLKGEAGQVNEALAMLLCHNICVLIREAFENGTSTSFDDVAHLFPSLHIKAKLQEKDG